MVNTGPNEPISEVRLAPIRLIASAMRKVGNTVEQIALPGVPLGSFMGVTYDEVPLPLSSEDVFVFCSDGVSEAMNRRGEEFTSARLIEVVKESRTRPAKEIVHAIVQAVEDHRGGYPPNDDMTVVALRISATAPAAATSDGR